MRRDWRLWGGRVLIGLVFFFNVQCAVAFLLNPAGYAGGFELTGTAGEAAVRGMGILFLMWNVPYALALLHPRRHWVSLNEAVVMQIIGVVGESLLLITLPEGHAALRVSIGRFIVFDGSGVIALLAAWKLIKTARSQI